MKSEDWLFMAYVDWLDNCYRMWKIWEDWLDMFWYFREQQ